MLPQCFSIKKSQWLSSQVSSLIKQTIFAALMLMLALTQTSFGHGYHGHKTAQFTQPDGTVLNLIFHGSELYARTTTTDGYTVIFDPKTKAYYYAQLNDDASDFVSSKKLAGKTNPKSLGLAKGLQLNPKARAKKIQKKREKMEAVLKERERWDSLKKARKNYHNFKKNVEKKKKAGKKGFALPLGTIFPDSQIPDADQLETNQTSADENGPSQSPPSFTLTSDVVGLTILVDFSDDPGTAVTREEIDDWANKPNYTGFSNAGSVYDYFFTQSNGRLRYSNNVTYYVRVPRPRTYYDDTSKDAGLQGRLLLNDALDVLIADGYDFSPLTTKSGGRIRACNVFFAGNTSGVWSQGLWPHRWVLSPQKEVAPGMYVYDYQITNIGSSGNLSLGTFIHENGHMLLGYPDFYSYDGNAARISTYSVMAASGGRHPSSLDSYMKEASGWMDVVDLNSSSHQRCSVQVDNNLVYRYRNPSNPSDYFMWEVRDNTGWEGPRGGSTLSVNPTSGLVTWHILETGSNTRSSIFTGDSPNADYSKPYELLVLEANPSSSTTPWYDDPTPGTNDGFKGSDKNQLSDTTIPALKFWDTSNNTGRTVNSNCEIHSISNDGPAMTFVIGNGAPSGSPEIVVSRKNIYASNNYGANAPAQTFSICNGQGGTLNYTVSDNASWLACDVTSGSATIETDTINVTFNTAGLNSGNYTGTITINDGGSGTETITVYLTVFAQPTLSANPTSLTVTAPQGSTSPVINFNLKNIGGGSCSYTVSSTQSWLNFGPTSGNLVQESDLIQITLDTNLSIGVHNGIITITSPEANNSPINIPITYTISSVGLTSPNGGEVIYMGQQQNISWTSSVGGNVKIDLLKNDNLYQVIANSTPNDGLFEWLVPNNIGSGDDYKIRISSLQSGSGTDTSDNNFSITELIYSANMDTDPGWTLQGDWAYGTPTGGGGSTGQPDPLSGYTGSNVIGYNLNGDYPSNLAETYATTQAIDCSLHNNVTLRFYRWLNVETSAYDKAFVRVSNDGINWTQIWANPGQISDPSWSQVSYDISSVADGQSTVYIRWVMGTTDGSLEFSGWNIDDVTLEGDYEGPNQIVGFSTDAYTVDENAGTATITVNRIRGTTGAVSVNYATSNGTASSGSDYTSTSGTLNWADGDNTSKTFTIPIINDNNHESSQESVNLTLSNATGASIAGTNPATLFINEDDNQLPIISAGSNQTVNINASNGSLAPTTGTSISLDAALDDGTNNIWEDSKNRWNLTIDPGVNFISNTNSSLGGITSAYDFPGNQLGTGGCLGDSLNAMFVDRSPITLELWFKPDSNSGHPVNGQVLWETGGGVGFGVFYRNGSVKVSHDTNSGQLISSNISSLTNDFIQVAVTYHPKESTDNYKLYINGELEATASRDDGDMCGGDGSGLGKRGGNNAGGAGSGDSSTTSFDGKIAVFRSYHNRILNDIEIRQNYESIASFEKIAIANLNGTGNDPDGDTISYTWSVVSGPGPVFFGNSSSINTTATFVEAGTYTLRLTADDGYGNPVSNDIVITVRTNSTLTYDGNANTGGTPPADPNSPYLTNDTVTVLGNTGSLTKSGFSFNGWNTQADGLGTNYGAGQTFTITTDTTLYADWTPSTYTVNFNKQGGTGGSNSVTVDYGAAMPNASAPTRSGFGFAGYYTAANGGGTRYYDEAMNSVRNWDIEGNTTLYAYWNASPVANAGNDQTVYLSNVGFWTPSRIATNLWLDADDANTITLNGSTVSQWNDKSGNNRNATQSTDTVQPTLVSSGLNGKNALMFDGSGDVFEVDLDFLANTSHSAFIVTKTTSYSNIYGAANGGQGSGSLHVGFSSSSSYRTNYWGNSWAQAIGPEFIANQANLLNYVWIPGSRKEVFANGTSQGSTTNAGNITAMAGGGRIGRSIHSAYGGDIAEIIMITGGISNENKELIEGYLAHKWGIEGNLPNSHTYKNEAPSSAIDVDVELSSANASDPENDTTTATWSVISGPAPVTFNNVNALNATATFNEVGIYTLRLTISDGYSSSFDDVVITVSPPQAAYQTWTESNFTNPFTVTGANNDPDGDGLMNFMEFAFGTDPTITDGAHLVYVPNGEVTTPGMPIIEEDQSNDMHAVFIRRKNFDSDGITYTVEFSADLSSWTSSMTGLQVVTGASSPGDYEAVSVPFPNTVPLQAGGSDIPKYFRVQVSME